MSLQALVRRAFEFSKSELRGLALLFIVSLLVRFAIISFLDWRQQALDRQLEGYLLASQELLRSIEKLDGDALSLGYADTSQPDTGHVDTPKTSGAQPQLHPVISTILQPVPPAMRHGQARPAVLAVDINTADRAAFEALPGIGPVLSARAIRFRDALGGFMSVDQFSELYGLKDSVFVQLKPYLRCAAIVAPNQLDINYCTLDELKRHPYVAPWVAEAIVKFRTSSGQIYSLSELKALPEVTDSLFDKLVPYLVVN